MKKLLAFVLALLFLIPFTAQSESRDSISIVGSSTVYPFATVVAEQFGKSTQFKTPKIESTGSGGGLKLFCAGVGVEHPDITNASRRIKKSEYKKCMENGVSNITEIKIGYDGIVIANSKKSKKVGFDVKYLFLALAKNVPNPDGSDTLVSNPYKTWKDINPLLPNLRIKVLGPPPTSGTRDAFVELVMENGAKKFDFIKKLDKKEFKAVAHTIREDGGYVEAGENDNLIVQKLEADPAAFGIFGFSFLDQNMDKIQGARVGGVEPTFENIANGSYPISRPLFFYVKNAHVDSIPGMREYLKEFTSEKAWGNEGYLSEKGMIPMPKEEREKFSKDARDLTPLVLE